MHYQISLEGFVESFVSYLQTHTTVSYVSAEYHSGYGEYWWRNRPGKEEVSGFRSNACIFFTPHGDVKAKIDFFNRSSETVEEVTMRIFEEYMLEIIPASEHGTTRGMFEFYESDENVLPDAEQELFRQIYERAMATAERMIATHALAKEMFEKNEKNQKGISQE